MPRQQTAIKSEAHEQALRHPESMATSATAAASSDDAIATAVAPPSSNDGLSAPPAAAAAAAHSRGASSSSSEQQQQPQLSGSELASLYKAGAADARAHALQHRAHKRAASNSIAAGTPASESTPPPPSGLHSRSPSAVGAMDAISRLAANLNLSRHDDRAEAQAERVQMQLQSQQQQLSQSDQPAAAHTQTQVVLEHPDRIDEDTRPFPPLHITPPTRSTPLRVARPHRRGLSENFLSSLQSQRGGGGASVMDLFSTHAQQAPPPSATSTSPSSASSAHIQRSHSNAGSARTTPQLAHLMLPLSALPSGLHLRNKSVGSATAASALPSARSNPASSRFGTLVEEMLKQRQAAAAVAAAEADVASVVPLADSTSSSDGSAALLTPTPIPEMSPEQSPTAAPSDLALASSLFNGLASPTTLSRTMQDESLAADPAASSCASFPAITLDDSSAGISSSVSSNDRNGRGGSSDNDLTAALMQSSPRHHANVLRPAPQTIGMLSALRQEQRRQQRQIHDEMKAGPPTLSASSSLSLDARLAHASGGFAGGLHVRSSPPDASSESAVDSPDEHMPSLSLDRCSISHWPEHVPLFSRHAGQSPSPHAVALLRSKPARRTPLEVCMLACWLGQRSLTGNFLSGLSPESLLRLAARAGYEKVAVSSFIAREGQESDRVFLLLTGMVSVWERSGAAAALANISIHQAQQRMANQAPDQLRVGRKLSMNSMGGGPVEEEAHVSKESSDAGLGSSSSSASSSKRSSTAAAAATAATVHSPSSSPSKPLVHSASSSITSTSLASLLTPAVQYPSDMPLDVVRESMFLIKQSEASSSSKGLRFLNLVGVGHRKGASSAQAALALAMQESKQRIILENEGNKTLGAYTAHAEPNAHLAFAQALSPPASNNAASSSYVPVLTAHELRKHEEYLSHVNGDLGFAQQFADLSRLARSSGSGGGGGAHEPDTIIEEQAADHSTDEASFKDLLAVHTSGSTTSAAGAGSSPLLHAPCPVLGLQGVLFGSRRSASVVTEELCEFLTLPRWIVEAVGLGRMLRDQITRKIALLRDRINLFRKYRSPDHPLYQAVEKNVLRLLYYFRLVSFSGCIIAQGERLRHCYFILEGEVEIRARTGTAEATSKSGGASEGRNPKLEAAASSSPSVALYTLGPGEVFNEESSFLPPAVFAVSSAQALLHGPHATNPYSAYARSATVVLLQIRPAQLRQFLLPALHQDLRALCRLKRGLRADRLLSVAASQRKKMRAEAGVAAAIGGAAPLSSVTSLLLAQSNSAQHADKSGSIGSSASDAGSSALQSLHPLLPARSKKALLSRAVNIAAKPVPAQYAVSTDGNELRTAGDQSSRSLVAASSLAQSASAVQLPFVSAQHAASSSLGAGQGNAAAVPLAGIIPSLILPVVAPATASKPSLSQRGSKLQHAHSARGPITFTVEEQMAGSAQLSLSPAAMRGAHDDAGAQSASGADVMTPCHPLLQPTLLLSGQAMAPANHQLALPFELTGARPLPESHFSGMQPQQLRPSAAARKSSHDGAASDRSALSRRGSTTRARELSDRDPAAASSYALLSHSASLSSIGAALSMRNIRNPSQSRRGGGGALFRGDSKQRRQQQQLDNENSQRSVRRERAKLAAAVQQQREENALSLSPAESSVLEASQAASLAKELSYNVQRAHWGRNALREEDWAPSDPAGSKRGHAQHQVAQSLHAPILAALTPQAVYHDPFLLTSHLLQSQQAAATDPRDKQSSATSDGAPVLPARSLLLFPTSHDFQSIAQTNHLTRSLVKTVTRSVVESIQQSARHNMETDAGSTAEPSQGESKEADSTAAAAAAALPSLPASSSSHTRIPSTIMQMLNGSARHASLTGGVSSLLSSANSTAARRAEYEELKEMQSAASLLDRPTMLAGAGGSCFVSSVTTSSLNLYSPKQNTPWRHLMAESRSQGADAGTASQSAASSPRRQPTVSFEATLDEAVDGGSAAAAPFAPHAPPAGSALISPRTKRLGSRSHTSEADSVPALNSSVSADTTPAAASSAAMTASSASILSQHHLHPSASAATLSSSSLSVSPSLSALVARLQHHVSAGAGESRGSTQPLPAEDAEWSALSNRNEHQLEIARRLARIKQQQQQKQQQTTLDESTTQIFAPHLLSSPSASAMHPLPSSKSLSTLRDADFAPSAVSSIPAATHSLSRVAPRMLHWDAMSFAGDPLASSSSSSSSLPLSAAALRVSSSASAPAAPPALPSWRLVPLHSARDIGNAFQLAQHREQARHNRSVAAGAHTDRARASIHPPSTSSLHLGTISHRRVCPLSPAEAARRFFKLGFPSRTHEAQ